MASQNSKPFPSVQLGLVLGSVMLATPTMAQNLPNGNLTQGNNLSQDYASYHQLSNQLNQVNSITQFRDVSPTSWSYEALRNLVENYGCIVGYPDGTYRGDRALTRNEFAAGLSACLNQIEKRIIAAKNQSYNDLGSSEAYSRVLPAVQPGDQLINVFTRGFYNETGRLYDITDMSGQANKMFGWRTFPGSFFDNQIKNDGLTFETIYHDAMRQQAGGRVVRTQDLNNPFTTSLQQNPGYLRMSSPTSSDSPLGYSQ